MEDRREKRFPIMQDRAIASIPFGILEPHRVQAQLNHAQTLEVLAERGGLTTCEAVAVLEDRAWYKMSRDGARRRLMQLMNEYKDQKNG